MHLHGQRSSTNSNQITVGVIIPAFNEEQSIRRVLDDIPREFSNDAYEVAIRQIVVVDNGSTDATASVAEKAGAKVLYEPRSGYGQACFTGLQTLFKCDIVVFLDGDYSDYPEEMQDLIIPICKDGVDLVIGSRTRGKNQPGALLPQAIIGNFVSTWIIRLLFGVKYTDLGPFRAVSWEALKRIDMQDRDFGWTVEMQVKAAKLQMRTLEVPVSYRKRIGRSKISGTLAGSVRAGFKILLTIYRHAR